VGLGSLVISDFREQSAELVGIYWHSSLGIEHAIHGYAPVVSSYSTREIDKLFYMGTLSGISRPPQPPLVIDDQRVRDLELAVQRQLLDGKALKRCVLDGRSFTQEPWVVGGWSIPELRMLIFL